MQPLAPSDPDRLGPFTLVGRLGAGGMGAVYLGQSSGGRKVAIKIIHDHLANDPGFRLRFTREVAAARQVGGLYTAQVVDADTEAPMPWMATRFVAGPSLSAHVSRDGVLDPQQVRVLAAGVGEALASIHAQGLVHRDLKPGNVLLSPDGPQVIDFGIAVDREATSFTSTGVLLGTFEFISPEQVQNRPVTPAADVFALGGLLCYAATGAPPFGSAHPAVLIARVVDADPDLTRITDPGLHDLVAACLAKRPERRPTPTQILEATAPARAVARLPYTTTAPVPVFDAPAPSVRPRRPDAPATMPRRALLGGAALAVTAALGGGVWWATRDGTAPVPDSEPEHRDFAGHPDGSSGLALSPDGRTVLVAHDGGEATLVSAADGRLLHRLVGHSDAVNAVAFSPDGSTAFTASGDRTVILWDVASGTARRTIPYRGGAMTAVGVSPDGRRLVTGSADGSGQIWNLATGALEHRLPYPKPGLVIAARFSPDGRHIVTTDLTGPARVWDTAKGTKVFELPHAKGSIAAAYSPDGKTLATSENGPTLRLWSAADGKRIAELTEHTANVIALAWSPDGTRLVSGSGDRSARVWNVATRLQDGAPIRADAEVFGVAVTTDARSLLTTTLAGTTTVWSLADRTRTRTLPPILSKLQMIAADRDGRTLASGAYDGSVRVWRPNGTLVRAIPLPKSATPSRARKARVNALAFVPDGSGRLVAGLDSGRLLWYGTDGSLTRTAVAEPREALSGVLGVTPLVDGSVLVITAGDEFQHWNASGAKTLTVPLRGESAQELWATPDATMVVIPLLSGRVQIRNARTGALVRQWTAHSARTATAHPSPDGASVVTASDDGTVRLWKLADGSRMREFVAGGEAMYVARFSRDGRRIAAGGKTGKVTVWGAATGATVAALDHPGEIEDLAFLADGSLVVACLGGTLRRWNLPA